jgi:hypothetical protein
MQLTLWNHARTERFVLTLKPAVSALGSMKSGCLCHSGRNEERGSLCRAVSSWSVQVAVKRSSCVAMEACRHLMFRWVELLDHWLLVKSSQSQSYFTTDGQSVSQYVLVSGTPQVKSKSKSFYDWQSVNQYVLVSSPLWDMWPDAVFLWKVSIWRLLSYILLGALSDEMSGLSFVSLSQ